MVIVHKRTGGHEQFKEKKVYNSCYKASLSAQLGRNEAKKLATICVSEVKREVGKHKHIASHEIRNIIKKVLKKYNKDVAIMYEAIKEVS